MADLLGTFQPLFVAIEYDDLLAVRDLLNRSVDPNPRDDDGNTALMWTSPILGTLRSHRFFSIMVQSNPSQQWSTPTMRIPTM